MQRIEALQAFNYRQVERNIGDQFDADDGHARALSLVGKAKLVGEPVPDPVAERPKAKKKRVAD